MYLLTNILDIYFHVYSNKNLKKFSLFYHDDKPTISYFLHWFEVKWCDWSLNYYAETRYIRLYKINKIYVSMFLHL